jgi:hypothetical protein
MARQGLNAVLSYKKGNVSRAYRVRANMLAYGMAVIYEESSSRINRAFYPHRLSSAQFAMGVELNGEDEYKSFSAWMATYAGWALSQDTGSTFPSMTVALPARGFLRKGVPLDGYDWGDHVGAMVWSPVITFETADDPINRQSRLNISTVNAAVASVDRDVRFFYPTGTQLTGNAAPPDGTFAKVLDSTDLAVAVYAGETAAALQTPTLGGGGEGIIVRGTGSQFRTGLTGGPQLNPQTGSEFKLGG